MCILLFLNHYQHTPKMGHPAKIDIEGVSDTQAIVIPDPLTVNGLSAHRARAPKLVAGVAAWTSSDMFKTLVCSVLQKLTTDLWLMTTVNWQTKIKEMGP